MTADVRIAVAGLGVMGRQHVRVLSELPGVELVGVADASESARQGVEEHVSVAAVADWTELLDSPADAVINALPTPEHHQVTKAFLEAGKHVLVEKPIALTSAEAEDLVLTADRVGRLLVVGHVERFNPAVRGLRGLIERGELGDIVTIAARRVGIARPVAPQTDVVVDLAIHDIDVCSYLLPESQGRLAFASGRALWGNQQEDHADLVLRFGDAVAIVQANWITPIKIRRVTVTGTGGARRRRLSRAVSSDLSWRPGGVRRPALGLLRRRARVGGTRGGRRTWANRFAASCRASSSEFATATRRSPRRGRRLAPLPWRSRPAPRSVVRVTDRPAG